MPAKPSYSHRLGEAVTVLECLPHTLIDRRHLEEILGVSKTVAWRIMRQCGAVPGPGGSLVCPREDLIERLRHLENDGAVHEREIQRRNRLDQFLSHVRPAVVANLTRIASDERAITLLSSTFQKLPPTVRLTPHRLEIQFSGLEDFLTSFGAIVYALHNDLDEIREWMEKAS